MRMLINGEWRESLCGRTFEVKNPATGESIDEAPLGCADDVSSAVDAAGEVYTDWSARSQRDRGKILFLAAQEVRRQSTELGELLTAEQGKPIREAVDEIHGFAHILEYYSSLGALNRGEYLNVRGYGHAIVSKRPLGICGCIIPWNMPALIMGWKIGPALLAGNTVVIKPARTAPLTCLRLGEILLRAGLPPGVLNVVTGSGETVGREIVRHPAIRKVSFTGEFETGRQVALDAAPAMKRVTLELGGSDAMIVCPDADLQMAVEGAVRGRFYNCGQTCTAVKRLFIHASVSEKFVKLLRSRVESMRVGNGLDRNVSVGPLNNPDVREHLIGQVERARDEGGTIITGGRLPSGKEFEKGFYYLPTLVTDLPADSVLFSQEVFGPVLPIATIQDLDEGIEKANNSRYGLGASIWTRNAEAIAQATEYLEAGIVWVNQHLRVPPDVPFGGTKDSGIGRENGSRALDEYLEERTILLRL
jgi:betaine-aldehyde dehydrogenase